MPELPPLPPGFKLDASSTGKELPPLPAGFVLDSEAPDFSGVQSGSSSTAPVPKAPDNRTPAQLAKDQLVSFAKGALLGLPKAAWGLGEAAGETTGKFLTGDVRGGMARGAQGLSDAYHGVADPIEHAGELYATALGAPGTETTMDPERLARSGEAAGAATTAAALGTGPMKTELEMPSSHGFTRIAEGAREFANNNPIIPSLEGINITKPATAVTGTLKALANPAARGVARLADRFALAQAAKEAVAGPRVPSLPTGPDFVPAEQVVTRPVTEVPAEPYPADMYAQQRQADLAAQAEASMNNRPTVVPQEQPVVRQPYSPPAEQHNPAMFGEQAPLQELGAATPEVEAMMKQNADVVELQNQINPSGRQAQTWVARNASRLYDLMPELRGVPLGERFRVYATNGFKNFEAAMKAAQNSIPPETMLPKAQLVEDLIPIKAEAALANRPAVLKILNKVDDLAPNMKWEDFVDVKEGIRKSPGFATDPFMRRAYGAFMEAASKVSPELAKANADFATSMRLLEHSKIDPVSGQFLKQPR